jgi:serine/threonine-protein kinase
VSDSPGWQVWFVGAVAALAVLGLIPLWAVVYRTFADFGQPTPTPVITPAITTVPNTAIVPQLVGLPVETAREEAARAGLGLVIEERDAPDYPLPTVLEQDPPAGQNVPAASQMKLVVSRRVPSSAVPDVVGFTVDEVREGLRSRGWVIATDEIWSSEPVGRILGTEPPLGTVLAAGETLTLTLSAGTSRPLPLEVNLNNLIFLESVEIQSDRYAPGQTIPLVLRWRALQPVADSYTVFVHLIGPGGGLVAQEDREPRVGGVSLPTNSWTPGVIVADSHSVAIPSNAFGGGYQLRTGMYLPSSGQRLPVLDAGRTQAQDGSILVMDIQIAP